MVEQDDEESGPVYTRVSFRLPEAMGKLIMEAGKRVGYDTMGASTRHCAVVGLQFLMQQQGVSRSADATAAMAVIFQQALALEQAKMQGENAGGFTKLDTIGHKSADLENKKGR